MTADERVTADKRRSDTVRSYLSVSPSQHGWAVAGLAVLIVIAVIAFANVRDIYNAQKDFVVGSMLSLVGFCLGKAISRTEENRALELVRTAPTPAVVAALTDETAAKLHRDGVFQQLAVLARNAGAAQQRLAEYYDSQCRQVTFYRYEPLLRIVLDDLDRVAANIADLGRILDVSPAQPRFLVPAVEKLALAGVQRDLREAIGRRDQAYEWYAGRLPRDATETWDLFAVATSDILKGARTLDALLAEHLPFPPRELCHIVIGYVDAAGRRATEFAKASVARDIQPPRIFDVMSADLSSAGTKLKEIEPRLAIAAGRADSAPTPSGPSPLGVAAPARSGPPRQDASKIRHDNR